MASGGKAVESAASVDADARAIKIKHIRYCFLRKLCINERTVGRMLFLHLVDMGERKRDEEKREVVRGPRNFFSW